MLRSVTDGTDSHESSRSQKSSLSAAWHLIDLLFIWLLR